MNAEQGTVYYVMGVSGCGKSSIGEGLANYLQAEFIDGDTLHPQSNIEKMRSGLALNDEDRKPWLASIVTKADAISQQRKTVVIVCSALKKSYRDLLRQVSNKVVFIYLKGEQTLIQQRLERRSNHFMPQHLLASQFATLEAPSAAEADVIPIEIDANLEQVLARCINSISRKPALN
ncbi:AAA family ATPase [Agarivorans sp. B2Z047]|uniref:gluconokinase n=1 Tax=Agarivorans sp. B2Z047 TaxID=2652721 RepID=UPI00128C3EBE|nr:gluconokinase [Agarivorans sp. B2Z047]MPW29241.1 AAA family ATPase [Agarivorans sp. B2Z047]UQN41794.1 gluconokinase [Agarivorans sp. B2Z047]